MSLQESWGKSRAVSPRVAIIGAGAAGCAVASRLAREGWNVTVFEAGSSWGFGGSGNELGLVTPGLGAGGDPVHTFLNSAHDVFWRETASQRTGRQTGVVQIPIPFLRRGKFPEGRRPVPAAKLSDEARVPIREEGLWFPDAGIVRPREWCRVLVEELPVTWHFGTRVEEVGLGDRIEILGMTFDWAVIATAWESPRVSESALETWCPLERVGGQVFRVRLREPGPHLPVVGRHYVLPEAALGDSGDARVVWIGATQERDGQTPEWSRADGEKILKDMQEDFPAWDLSGAQILSGRASNRAVLQDHLPIVGRLPRDREFQKFFEGLRHGREVPKLSEAPERCFVSNVFVCRGLGFRGLMVAPLVADMLVRQMLGETSAGSGISPFQDALDPARFLLRGLRRGIV